MNHYEKSWAIYKAHSESFQDDFDYYYNFSKGKRTLETFAGYGRVTNYLFEKGVDISANELSEDFAKYIKTPSSKIHVGNVLNFTSAVKYEKIFAAYNSFCLLLQDHEVRKLFSVFEQSLTSRGQVSLSYYHPDYWSQAAAYTFDHKGKSVDYIPSFDLSDRQKKRGVWRDIYVIDGEKHQHEYEVRIYEDASDLKKMLEHTRLKFVGEIHNYNNPNIVEEGWVEYILELQ